MKTLSLLFSASLLFLFSCDTGENTENTDSTKPPSRILAKPGSLVIGSPLDCGIDGIQIFPVGGNYRPEVVEGRSSSSVSFGFASNTYTLYDAKANAEYINTDENEYDIRNILFFNLKDGSSRALFPDNVHILSFSLHKEYPIPLIYYRVVKKDINNDSIFNNQDAVALYISRLNGDSLVQVTPDDEQFKEYFYYAGTHSILAKTVINLNNDSTFNAADETNFRNISLVNPAMGKEIFSRALRDSLRAK
jgi:hypothetical protein